MVLHDEKQIVSFLPFLSACVFFFTTMTTFANFTSASDKFCNQFKIFPKHDIFVMVVGNSSFFTPRQNSNVAPACENQYFPCFTAIFTNESSRFHVHLIFDHFICYDLSCSWLSFCYSFVHDLFSCIVSS